MEGAYDAGNDRELFLHTNDRREFLYTIKSISYLPKYDIVNPMTAVLLEMPVLD